MSESMQSIVRLALNDEGCIVRSTKSLAGGCINNAQKVTLSDGRVLFVKTNKRSLLPMFEAEAKGLLALQETKTSKVPTPISAGELDTLSFLILEWIEPGRPTNSSSSQLGIGLAELHQHSGSNRFGFEVDNFLGATHQKNDWQDDWPHFLIANRFEPQFELARSHGFRFTEYNLDRFYSHLEKLELGSAKPSLIHGDLWSGNYMIDATGVPYLIDPAPYWGNREAEFGILTMFGGFDSQFFEAYENQFPFDAGFEDRLPIYQLYHYLNHLNLFGSSYLGSCTRILARYT